MKLQQAIKIRKCQYSISPGKSTLLTDLRDFNAAPCQLFYLASFTHTI